MCTVTYIPTRDNEEFIFTSSRDEAPSRGAEHIKNKVINGHRILFPQDKLANGTWVAMSNTNRLVCILNGAFKPHKRKDKYRKSRGLVASETFSYESASSFLKNYNLYGIEPFTMILYDNGKLFDLKWDEKIKHIRTLDPQQNHIWSSANLYSEEWQNKREQWLSDWLDKNEISQTTLLDFHHNAGEGNERYNLRMRIKDIVKTTSITSIHSKNEEMNMRFESLTNEKIIKASFKHALRML